VAVDIDDGRRSRVGDSTMAWRLATDLGQGRLCDLLLVCGVDVQHLPSCGTVSSDRSC